MFLGHIYKPDSKDPCTLPSKAIPHLCVLTTDANPIYAPNLVAVCAHPDSVGWGSHYYPWYPVPATNAMEAFCYWVLQPGIPAKVSNRYVAENRIQEVLYLVNGAIIIFSDAIIIVLPVAILWDVQITQRRKWAVYTIFFVRIL